MQMKCLSITLSFPYIKHLMQKFDEEKLDFRLHRRNINIGRKHFDDCQSFIKFVKLFHYQIFTLYGITHMCMNYVTGYTNRTISITGFVLCMQSIVFM